MTAFEISWAGPASVFTLIIGYFVMTVWFGKAETPQPVVQRVRKPGISKLNRWSWSKP